MREIEIKSDGIPFDVDLKKSITCPYNNQYPLKGFCANACARFSIENGLMLDSIMVDIDNKYAYCKDTCIGRIGSE